MNSQEHKTKIKNSRSLHPRGYMFAGKAKYVRNIPEGCTHLIGDRIYIHISYIQNGVYPLMDIQQVLSIVERYLGGMGNQTPKEDAIALMECDDVREFITKMLSIKRYHGVNLDISKKIIKVSTSHTRGHLKRYINAELYNRGSLGYLTHSIGFSKAVEVLKTASDKMRGSNNPAYQHKGLYSPHSKNFIKYRDINSEEVIKKIHDVNEKRLDTTKRNNNFQMTKEYYTSRGLSEKEATLAVSRRQTTFSENTCRVKYGENWKSVFDERQSKWQTTLNSKPQHEIDDINKRKKSPGSGHTTNRIKSGLITNETIGQLYYVSFEANGSLFYKIGISANGVYNRFASYIRSGDIKNFTILCVVRAKYFNCFNTEQMILKNNEYLRVKIISGKFTSSEVFVADVDPIKHMLRVEVNPPCSKYFARLLENE